MSNRRESLGTVYEETRQRYSIVPKLVHYASKFRIDEEEGHSTLQTSVRYQPPSRYGRRKSTFESLERFVLFLS